MSEVTLYLASHAMAEDRPIARPRVRRFISSALQLVLLELTPTQTVNVFSNDAQVDKFVWELTLAKRDLFNPDAGKRGVQ